MTRATALRRLALTLAAAVGPSACGLNQEGVAPPPNTFFYPSTAILDRTGGWLYVANSNADLRYNDGTLVMVNVGDDAADGTTPAGQMLPIFSAQADRTTRAGQWGPCPMGDYVNTPRTGSKNLADVHFCCWDPIDVNVLNCDERAYIPADSSVRIGSFAAGIVRQERVCSNADLGAVCTCQNLPNADHPTTIPDDRLFVSVRGDTSLTFLDVSRVDAQAGVSSGTAPTFKCLDKPEAPTSGSFAICNDDHRFTGDTPGLATLSPDANPARIALPNEPYALALDARDGLLFVGHLTGDTSHPYTGGYSLFDVAPRGDEAAMGPPRFVAPFPSPFAPNGGGFLGITTLSQARPADATVFATSRYLPQVAGLSTIAPCPVGGLTRDIIAAPSGEFYDTSLVGAETRGIAFASVDTGAGEISRAFVLQRVPPALVAFDSTIAVSVLETCQNPTYLYRNRASDAVGDRLFVSCYDTGEIYVFDPSVPRLETTFQIGRGPAGLVFPPGGGLATVAYVVGFGDNDVSVIDLQPGSPTEYHVIQRIGFPSEVPR